MVPLRTLDQFELVVMGRCGLDYQAFSTVYFDLRNTLERDLEFRWDIASAVHRTFLPEPRHAQ